jgi:hypothetical protein
MALRLPTSSKNTRGLERDNNAKLAATPHRRGTIMVRQARERNNWKLGQTQKAVHKQLQFDLQETIINQNKSKLAHRSTMNHFDHTYNGGASSKILQSMFPMKEQLMLSQFGYDK